MHTFSKKDIEILVLIAAKKLNKYDELSSDPNARQLAMEYFQNNMSNFHTAEDLANTALLGVMNVYIPGNVQPIVRYNWGNETAAPDVSPTSGGSGGGATIYESNRMDHLFGQDSLGTEARVVANYLNAGEFDAKFVEYLRQYGLDTTAPTPSTTPKPKPT